MKSLIGAGLLALLATTAPVHAQANTTLDEAARATSIEGRWQWDATSLRCSNERGTGNAIIKIGDGVLVRTYMDFGDDIITFYAITRVEDATVFVTGVPGEGETSFTVNGNVHDFYQPERRNPGEFTKPASTQRYNRC
jgi:hypothetical protein